MEMTSLEMMGTCLFAIAVLHTFLVSFFQKLAHKFPEGSVGENFFHFLGEVEVVFGIWAALFIAGYSWINGFKITDGAGNLSGGGLYYLENLNFTEPIFVFVIMTMAATQPVIFFAESLIHRIAKLLPFSEKLSFFVTTLTVGPLLGSFITEPAAMTLTALILLDYFFADGGLSEKFKYAIIGALFVNISIGGTLTHFAAPPVLMVAGRWGWDMAYMMDHFGYKAILSVIIIAVGLTILFKKELQGKFKVKAKSLKKPQPNIWMTLIHLLFLALTVYTAHYPAFLLSIFLFFIGFVVVTKEYQTELKLKESLLVAFFLAGLIVLGSVQTWWLKPLLASLNDTVLYFGATALTAITDNAALTYLGSLVELSESAKYSLVAGAVTGGGLTVIANAPNPAGYSLLKESFKDATINPVYLFLAALIPTFIVILCFELLPTITLF